LIVPADGGEKKKMEENNKKGDSKGSGRAESGASGKEGTTSGANIGMKNKQDIGDGSKRLVSLIELRSTVRSTVVRQTGNVIHHCASDVLLLHNRRDGLSRSLSLSLSIPSRQWTSKMRSLTSHARLPLFPFFKISRKLFFYSHMP